MKKLKKLFAVMLSLIMVLAMGITSFADTTVQIKLNGLEDAETVDILQIIAPNTSTTSGWEFINGAGAKYAEAYKVDDTPANEQAIIWGLIQYQASENSQTVTLPTGVTPIAADATKIAAALEKVESLSGFVPTDSKTSTDVTSAGIYAIKAAGSAYTYKTMSAYVSFGNVESDNYPALTGTTVTAKKSPLKVTKVTKDTDNAVAIGDIVTYEIEAYVPVIAPSNTDNRTFTITDTITGADYYLDGVGAIKRIVVDDVDRTADFALVPNGNTFTIDFSSLVASSYNEHAGATFNVTKEGIDNPLKFTKDTEDGAYKYDPENGSADIVTDNNGKLVVKGLDKGNYHFTETVAPTGYSINTDGLDVALTYDGEKATANFSSTGAQNTVKDSTLNALPATGGIGTTIFTIVGCGIMIAAAGLFFASRRKENR